jgi:hypothetical protein
MTHQKLPQKYVNAKAEAERFLEMVSRLQQRFDDDERLQRFINITGSKETAAVKRASLDLTRTLAELRRSS